ncbi:MAG: thioredoxin family protein [Alphaproteobacteria bacterium]|nr:thioredoxin family protein [Alphaproteobacteria bacterium]
MLFFIAGQRDVLSADAYQKTLNSKLKIETQSSDFPAWGLLFTDKGTYEVELEKKPENIWILLMLAFFGGMVLNLMPCVFPVLSLKALAMVQKAGAGGGRFWRAFSYTSGVLCSFLAVAGVLFYLKKAGFAYGWGFQLQSPYFIGAMILLFIVILLFVLDVWHLNLPFLTKLSDISGIHSFLTGFFAVLIASPCTGPFMGAAIGYAMFESAEIYFPMFLSLGFGYAVPFAMLEMFPKNFKKIMPKPGIWMVRLKYVLSLPILLTIFWLGWVFYHQIGLKQNDDMWEPYSKEALEEALDNGDAVLIDFTAKWCLTCLLNEKTVLDSDTFLKKAQENNIRLFKADWTNRDEDIFKALKSYGRSSVPLYVYYHQDSENAQILPQILTIDSTLDVIEDQ